MPVRHASRPDLVASEPHRQGPMSFGRSMVAVAVLPRRYYWSRRPSTFLYFTVTAIPRRIDRQDLDGADSPPSRRPMVVTVAVLALAGRGLLRGSATGPRGSQRPGR